MTISLSCDQQAELAERRSDVDRLVAILAVEGRQADHATAFLAWADHSESYCASWIVIDSDDEVVRAYDSLVRRLIEKAARQAAGSIHEGAVAEFLADYIAQSPADPEDPELLTVSVDGVEIGKVRQWTSIDQGIAGALAEHLDIELPTDWETVNRSSLLEPLGVSITDQQGYDA